MAPTRSTKALSLLHLDNQKITGKRKAEVSPKNERIKRSALGNLTNALIVNENDENKKGVLTKKLSQEKDEITVVRPISSRTRAGIKSNNSTLTSSQDENEKQHQQTIAIDKSLNSHHPQKEDAVIEKQQPCKDKSIRLSRRISNDFEKTEESLYVSALEEIPSDSSRFSSSSSGSRTEHNTNPSADATLNKTGIKSDNYPFRRPIPPSVDDFDRENWRDVFQVSNYSMNIFEYLKYREQFYKIKDYMNNQPEISKWMRSLLVDWMVEVQESFELNHETLYLAVKIVDSYLGRERVSKDSLQLLGAAALLIACKYDERTPPLIDDFLFICDGAYKRSQLLKMEMTVFKAIDYDLSFPLSYRFLRRYARCGKISMVTLTLARYILESSLMDYTTIQLSDSKLACAALFISLRMTDMDGWNETYEHYSGYKLMSFAPIVILLNSMLHRKPKENLSTVRNKYSHKIFHQVTNIPLMDINKLFEKFPDVAKQLSSSNLTYQSIIAACGAATVSIIAACGAATVECPSVNMSTKVAKKKNPLPLPIIF